jgi:hypothetical protein
LIEKLTQRVDSELSGVKTRIEEIESGDITTVVNNVTTLQNDVTTLTTIVNGNTTLANNAAASAATAQTAAANAQSTANAAQAAVVTAQATADNASAAAATADATATNAVNAASTNASAIAATNTSLSALSNTVTANQNSRAPSLGYQHVFIADASFTAFAGGERKPWPLTISGSFGEMPPSAGWTVAQNGAKMRFNRPVGVTAGAVRWAVQTEFAFAGEDDGADHEYYSIFVYWQPEGLARETRRILLAEIPYRFAVLSGTNDPSQLGFRFYVILPDASTQSYVDIDIECNWSKTGKTSLTTFQSMQVDRVN